MATSDEAYIYTKSRVYVHDFGSRHDTIQSLDRRYPPVNIDLWMYVIYNRESSADTAWSGYASVWRAWACHDPARYE